MSQPLLTDQHTGSATYIETMHDDLIFLMPLVDTMSLGAFHFLMPPVGTVPGVPLHFSRTGRRASSGRAGRRRAGFLPGPDPADPPCLSGLGSDPLTRLDCPTGCRALPSVA